MINLSPREQYLINLLHQIPQTDYPIQSRIHRLSSFGLNCFIKRDDELGFGISGSKIRKYRSLIPFYLSQNIKEVVVIGSAYSNHVLGITQLLLENQIKPTLFLRGDVSRTPKGNSLLIQFLTNQTAIHWIAKTDWPDVMQMAQEYAKQAGHKTMIIPEGGAANEAFPGTLSLPLDISRNERTLNQSFNHLFIDSGTGMMASALILAYQWMQKPTLIHVVLMAGDPAFFMDQLTKWHRLFEHFLKEPCPFPDNFILHSPQEFASFGSTSPSLFKDIQAIAQTEGLFCDPIYTVKLFKEAKRVLGNVPSSEYSLILHSGGSLSLMGFQEQLLKLLI